MTAAATTIEQRAYVAECVDKNNREIQNERLPAEIKNEIPPE